MKKILVLLLALMMVFSFAACGTDEPADDPVQQEQQPDEQEPDEQQPEQQPPADIPEELEGYLATKTGKFYSQFADKMHMEYEMEVGHLLQHVEDAPGRVAQAPSHDQVEAGGRHAGVHLAAVDSAPYE